MNPKTVYLAGKITGDPNYKAKFAEAKQELVQAGFTVLDPSLLPPTGFGYDAYIRMSMAMLVECEAACFLPDWEESPGAINEHRRAEARRMKIFYFDEWRT